GSNPNRVATVRNVSCKSPSRFIGTSAISRQVVTNSYRLPLNPPLCLKTRSKRSVTKAATICKGSALSLRPNGSLNLYKRLSQRHQFSIVHLSLYSCAIENAERS